MIPKLLRRIAIRAFGMGALTVSAVGLTWFVQGYRLDARLQAQGMETTGIATDIERTSSLIATGTTAYTVPRCTFTLVFQTKEGQIVQSPESCNQIAVQENQSIPVLYLRNVDNSYDVKPKDDSHFFTFDTLLILFTLLFIGLGGLGGIFMPIEE